MNDSNRKATSRKLSTKEGKTSSAKKEDSTRHGVEPDPASAPVAGAFGKRGESLERGGNPTRQPADPDGALVDPPAETDNDHTED